MSTVIEEPTNEALLSLRDTGPESLVERIDGFIHGMTDVVKASEALVPAAEQFTVTTEAEFQFADEMRVALEQEAKSLDAGRMPFTRVLDDLKAHLMGVVRPGIDNNKAAAAIYNRKALDYRRAEREKAEAARREAERIQRETQARLEAEARKREAAAAKLKSEEGRRKAQEEAEALRQAAAMTPVTMAVSAPVPQATASNVVEKWEAEVTDVSAFLKWLSLHPEWQNVVTFGKAPLNRMASQYRETLTIPGLTITSSEAFRKKASR